jgi:hypothetical protein
VTVTVTVESAAAAVPAHESASTRRHQRVVEIASNLPLKQKFGGDHQLKFNFDLEYGPDMGSMTKVKLAA